MTELRKRCGAVILAGGHSRRMGTCKALLEIGGESMLARMTRQLDGFEERLLSANDPALAAGLPVTLVPDIYPGAGPLAGLHAALSAAESGMLFCVPCDMPHFTPALPRLLLARYSGEDALVCRDSTGRLYPLCGLYAKTVLPALEEQLRGGRHRVSELLGRIRCTVADMGGLVPDSVFFNMNTLADFRMAVKMDSAAGLCG